jgi:hypothetical protein
MAELNKTGAANAAAVWCTKNLLNGEKCSPLQRSKFKCSLESAIRQELNQYTDANIACVIKIRKDKPNKILQTALNIAKLANDMLTFSDVLIMVFPTVVWVDREFTSCSKALSYECIFKTTITTSTHNKRKKQP